MSRIEGLGKLAGQIVCEEGRPIYQGLVKEGIVKLTAWAFLIGTDVFWVLSSHASRETWHYEENHFTINASWIRTLFAMCAAMQWSMASDGLLLVQCPIAPEMVSPCPCSLFTEQCSGLDMNYTQIGIGSLSVFWPSNTHLKAIIPK